MGNQVQNITTNAKGSKSKTTYWISFRTFLLLKKDKSALTVTLNYIYIPPV